MRGGGAALRLLPARDASNRTSRAVLRSNKKGGALREFQSEGMVLEFVVVPSVATTAVAGGLVGSQWWAANAKRSLPPCRVLASSSSAMVCDLRGRSI